MLKIYYDGDCYFCSNYVEYVKLRSVVGDVELISVRDDTPEVRRIIELGYNLNAGFVVVHEDNIYYGSDAYAYLNRITRKDSILSKLLGVTGGNKSVSSVVYPFLVMLRIFVLLIQGLSLVDLSRSDGWRAQKVSFGVRIFRLTPLVLCLVYIGAIITGNWIFYRQISEYHQLLFLGLAFVSLLVFVVFFTRSFVVPLLYLKLRNASVATLIGWFCIWIAIINTGELIIERKILGLVGALPLIGLFTDLYLERRKAGSAGSRFGLVPSIYPVFLIVFSLFPGFYLAPFYGGIVGWVDKIDTNRLVEVSGIKFVNVDGKEIWHNPALLQPTTQIGRFGHAYLGSGAGNQVDYLNFIFESYVRAYPLLEEGRLPHQWALGDFAYPPHNLTHNNASAYVPDFAPGRISKIHFVSEYFDWYGNFIRSDIRTEILINSDGIDTSEHE